VREERGQDLVEFALIAPILFLLLFGLMEFGVAIWHYNTLAQAAREGARAALVWAEDYREDMARSAAVGYAQGVGIGVTNADVDYGDDWFIIADPVDETAPKRYVPTVAVTITYRYEGITGLAALLPSGGLTLQASSSMLVE